MAPRALRILDCTLRDGGYYTKWDFPRALVKKYVTAANAANIDVVELGFRAFPQRQFLGPYAYTPDDHIAELDVPAGLEVAVMIDARTLLDHECGTHAGVARLFRRRDSSPVSMVRVAAHFGDVERCEEVLAELRALGYRLGLNLMQAGGRPETELTEKAARVATWGTVDVLYFADSLGNMDAGEVARVQHALAQSWSGALGVHAHNNKGLAFQNTVAATKLGVTWLDATVTGMGRGAGNAPTELLTMELARLGHDYRPHELWELVMDDFLPLQRQYGWGASLLYHFAADHAIHPTYVQTLLGDSRYSSAHVRLALETLASIPSSSYSSEAVNRALEGGIDSDRCEGSWAAEGWCEGLDVAILGAGSSLLSHRQAIEQFVLARNAAVLSLNLNREFEPSLVTYYVAVDSMRMSLESVDYARLKRPFIMPVNRAPEGVRKNLDAIAHRDYGCTVRPGHFEAGPSSCEIPAPLSVAYALALCIVGGARRVWMAGFDGFPAGDARQEEMVELIETVRARYPNLKMVAITPTTYPVEQGSVYAPY